MSNQLDFPNPKSHMTPTNSTTPTTRTPTGRPLPPPPQRPSASPENTESLSAFVPEKKATAEMPRLSFLETSVASPEISRKESDLKASSPPEYPPPAIPSSLTVDCGARSKESDSEVGNSALDAFQTQPGDSPTAQTDASRQKSETQRLSRKEESIKLVQHKLDNEDPIPTPSPKDPSPPAPGSRGLAIARSNLTSVLHGPPQTSKPRSIKSLTSRPRSVNLPKQTKTQEKIVQTPTDTTFSQTLISPRLLRENNALRYPQKIVFGRPTSTSAEDITIPQSNITTDLPVILESVTDPVTSNTNQPVADSEPAERKKND